MRLYIWDGDGISSAYHDDGTLVVLAESPEQARGIVRALVEDADAAVRAWQDEWRIVAEALGYRVGAPNFWKWWGTPEGKAFNASRPRGGSEFFDGSESALDREPDRVVEVDAATWVAFNGGGYD